MSDHNHRTSHGWLCIWLQTLLFFVDCLIRCKMVSGENGNQSAVFLPCLPEVLNPRSWYSDRERAIGCKPKQNIATWFLTCNLYYHNWSLFRITRGFCVLVDNGIIWVSNKDKRIDELKSHRKENTAKIFFGWIRFTFWLIQSSGIHTIYKKS